MNLQEKIKAKVAEFQVGDTIVFHIPVVNFWEDRDFDPEEIELTGIIMSINGQFAHVKHQYGECETWLPIARRTHAAAGPTK